MRWLVSLLLCIALPLQGWAAAGGMALSMQRGGSNTEPAAVAASAAHEGCEGHHAASGAQSPTAHPAALSMDAAEVTASQTETHGLCSTCGACCIGSALLPGLPSLASHRAKQAWALPPVPDFPGMAPERLERPPRA